jgi:WD40 repeat protein
MHATLTQRWFVLAVAGCLCAGLAGGAQEQVKPEPPKVKADPPKAKPEPPKVPPEARVNEVWSLSVAPGGHTVAMARGFPKVGGSVALWDVAADAKKVLAQDKQALHGVAFSPDGMRVVSAGSDGALKIYDVPSGKMLHEMRGHNGIINSVAWSPDGQTLVTGGFDTTVRLWDPDNGIEIARLKGHTGWVLGTAFMPSSKEAVSSGKEGVIKIWDVATATERLTLKSGGGSQCVAVSADGTKIAAGAWDYLVRIWNAADGVPLATLRGHTAGVYGIAFSPDGETLASTSGNYGQPDRPCEIILWDVNTGQQKRTLRGHPGGIWCCAFLPDGKTLVTGGADHTVRLWDVGSGEERAKVTPPTEPVAAATADPAAPSGSFLRWLVPAVLVLGLGIMAWGVVRKRSKAAPAPAQAPAHDGTSIEVRCPSCDKRLRVASALGGKKVKCPACATGFVA